jgi:transposase-like protein
MAAIHSEAFIEQALVKVYSRGARSVLSVATEMNVKYHTLKYWMKTKSRPHGDAQPVQEKRPQDWTAPEQLRALQQTHGLEDATLQAWCRQHGIFAHHLRRWEEAFCGLEATPAAGQREVRMLKDENAMLRRDLIRKEKALAEAAALLVLQKKFRALWEDEEP